MSEMARLKPEWNETEKRALSAAKKKIFTFLSFSHPDHHHSSRHVIDDTFPSEAEQAAEIQERREMKKTRGIRTIQDVLNYLITKLTPDMTDGTSGEMRIVRWPESEDMSDENVVYFPKHVKMSQSVFIPLPATPEDFFNLINEYRVGRLGDESAYAKVKIKRAEGGRISDMVMRKRQFLDIAKNADTLEDLRYVTQPPPAGSRTPIVHINAISPHERTVPFLSDGSNVLLEEELNAHALHIIRTMAENVTSIGDFTKLQKEVQEYPFFPTKHKHEAASKGAHVDPSLKAANEILGKTYKRVMMASIDEIEGRDWQQSWNSLYGSFQTFRIIDAEAGKNQILHPIDISHISTALTRKSQAMLRSSP